MERWFRRCTQALRQLRGIAATEAPAGWWNDWHRWHWRKWCKPAQQISLRKVGHHQHAAKCWGRMFRGVAVLRGFKSAGSLCLEALSMKRGEWDALFVWKRRYRAGTLYALTSPSRPEVRIHPQHVVGLIWAGATAPEQEGWVRWSCYPEPLPLAGQRLACARRGWRMGMAPACESCVCTWAPALPPAPWLSSSSGCGSRAGSQPQLSPSHSLPAPAHSLLSWEPRLPLPPGVAGAGWCDLSAMLLGKQPLLLPSQPPSSPSGASLYRAALHASGALLLLSQSCSAPAELARLSQVGSDGKAGLELDSGSKTTEINRNSMAGSGAETVLSETKKKTEFPVYLCNSKLHEVSQSLMLPRYKWLQ